MVYQYLTINHMHFKVHIRPPQGLFWNTPIVFIYLAWFFSENESFNFAGLKANYLSQEI